MEMPDKDKMLNKSGKKLGLLNINIGQGQLQKWKLKWWKKEQFDIGISEGIPSKKSRILKRVKLKSYAMQGGYIGKEKDKKLYMYWHVNP